MKIIEIENALPQEMFDELVSKVTNWGEMPWYFAPNSAYEDAGNQNNQYSWAHTPILEGKDNSFLADDMRKYCQYLEDTYLGEEKTYGIRRVRFGMHTSFDKNYINDPHIDFSKGSLVGLLYINDSDGDTHFWDRFYSGDVITKNDELLSAWNSVKEGAKIIKSVTPKANKIVFFDGCQYHASTTPSDSLYRIIMNINWYNSDPILDLVLQ